MTIPAWLRQHLIDEGKLDITGISRRARMMRCRSCGARVLAGLDSDFGAFDAYVDPRPLTNSDELMALLQGRQTYRIYENFVRIEVDHRIDFHISHAPASTCVVMAEHKCGMPPLGLRVEIPPSQLEESECPF